MTNHLATYESTSARILKEGIARMHTRQAEALKFDVPATDFDRVWHEAMPPTERDWLLVYIHEHDVRDPRNPSRRIDPREDTVTLANAVEAHMICLRGL